jgi:hypothetical protein
VDALKQFDVEGARETAPEGLVGMLGGLAADPFEKRFMTEQDLRDIVREEVAEALRELRAKQFGLMNKLVDSMIRWTVGTGIVVAAVIVAVLKWF